jgi:hypothetical protein
MAPKLLGLRLRDAVYAGPYAAWIPTMPPSQGVVRLNTPLHRLNRFQEAPPAAAPLLLGRDRLASRARRADPACCARPGGRAAPAGTFDAVVELQLGV